MSHKWIQYSITKHDEVRTSDGSGVKNSKIFDLGLVGHLRFGFGKFPLKTRDGPCPYPTRAYF